MAPADARPEASVPRVTVFLLYLPLLLALCALIFRALQVLVAGAVAGLFFLPYAAVLWLLGRRALRVVKGKVAGLQTDAVLLLAADALLVFLALTAAGR